MTIPVYLLDVFTDRNGYIPVPVGELKTDPLLNQIFFRYYERYLQLGEKAVPVDIVNLPLKSSWQNIGRHGGTAIRDTAPDAWGRTVVRHCTDTSKFHELDYISFPNPTRMGNLDFGKPCMMPPASFSELSEIQRIYRKIEQKVFLERNELNTLRAKFYAASIGGGRPKCVIEENDKLWIVKLASIHDNRSDAAMEAASLALAKKCGINICYVELRNIDGYDALFVKRFDREDGRRLGFLSAHSMLGMGKTTSMADDDMLRDYRLLAQKIKKFGFKKDLLELYKRIAFNIIIRNRDDHERNHGFLIKNGRAKLAPAYDIVPTGIDTDMQRPPIMAMKIGVFEKEGSKRNLLSSAKYFNLSVDEAETIFDSIAETVGLAWRETFFAFGVSEENLDNSKIVFEYLENKNTTLFKP